jgi:asparagine synthase (glutamine-hydrolysing)
MGGFLLTRRPETDTDGVGRALAVFASKGLRPSRRLELPEHDLHVFQKVSYPIENVVEMDGGDFVCATGTLLEHDAARPDTLRRLYERFRPGMPADQLPRGEYAVAIRKNGATFVFTCPSGLYHVYTSEDGRHVSTSFLALRRAAGQARLAHQEFYEYILHGAVYGEQTLLQGIRRLDSRSFHALDGSRSEGMPAGDNTDLAALGFDGAVTKVGDDLMEYFSLIATTYEDQVCSALSGGYDSRLILGLLRQQGISPYLYVYGRPHDADVRVARAIAEGEEIPLHVTDHSSTEVPTPERYREVVRENFLFKDGLGNEGVLDTGSDLATRRERVARARLQLNGGGGEIYRNFWVLPDRSYTTHQFLTSKFDRFDYAPLRSTFDKQRYFSRLAEKVRVSVGARSDRLTRPQVEQLYADFRLRYWMGINNSNNAQYADTLTPFGDYRLTRDSFTLPLAWKNEGRFEAALIRQVDPALARYLSCYGHDFVAPPTKKRVLQGTLMRHVPIALRPLLRRRAHARSSDAAPGWPSYLGREYLAALGLAGERAVDEFVDVDRVRSREILRRILTVELLLRDDL